MVFVTLGTQDKSFVRLLEKIESAINDGIIEDEVVVQAGYTKFKSDKMRVLDLLDRDEFANYVKKCDVLITHGGVGSIITGLKNNKKVIAVPRLAKYKEHVNDHQIQIIDNFDNQGYIIGLGEDIDLQKAFDRLKDFTPNKYKSNTENMIKLVEEVINN